MTPGNPQRRLHLVEQIHEGNEYFPYYPYFFIRAGRGDAERGAIEAKIGAAHDNQTEGTARPCRYRGGSRGS
jgi:hypothetical protein